MQTIAYPYRSSAASSLDLKIIELGNRLEKLEQYGSDIEKFSMEIKDAFKRFGYAKLHHIDIPMNPDCLLCINYYNLGKRIIVLSSDKARDYHGVTGYIHDDYYAFTLQIDSSEKYDAISEIIRLNSIPRILANIFLPGICTGKDWEFYSRFRKNSSKIDSFRSFMALF